MKGLRFVRIERLGNGSSAAPDRQPDIVSASEEPPTAVSPRYKLTFTALDLINYYAVSHVVEQASLQCTRQVADTLRTSPSDLSKTLSFGALLKPPNSGPMCRLGMYRYRVPLP